MPTSTQKKEKKDRKTTRRSSISLRLVFIQTRRVAAVMLTLDIVLWLLFAAGIIIDCELRARTIIPQLVEEAAVTETLPTPKDDNMSFTLHNGHPWGLRLKAQNNIIDSSRRNFYFSNKTVDHLTGNVKQAIYAFEIPGFYPDTYYKLGIDISSILYTFFVCWLILLLFEVVLLITTIFNAQKNVKNALAPIEELTQAAQIVSEKPTSPAQEKIRVKAAIDAIDAITGYDLDKRVFIDDEREELQGLAEAINSMLERLDAAYSSQLRFVSDASHELRTPIAVIQGYANLLDRWGKTDEQTLQESIDAIKLEAQNMQNLLEQLLFLARSDNQSISLNIESINLTDLMNEIFSESQMIDQHHRLEKDFDTNVLVQGDAQLIKQAVRIIIDNSIKFTPEDKSIKIKLNYDGRYACISITDEGVGISEANMSKLFDRFYRSDDSRTKDTGGTGLGLSIANWIVDAHNGHIDVVSREEVGTRMMLFFPVKYVKP